MQITLRNARVRDREGASGALTKDPSWKDKPPCGRNPPDVSPNASCGNWDSDPQSNAPSARAALQTDTKNTTCGVCCN